MFGVCPSLLVGPVGRARAAEAVESAGISREGQCVGVGDSPSVPLWMAAERGLPQASPEPQHRSAAKSCSPK